MKRIRKIALIFSLTMFIMLVFSSCSKQTVDTSKFNIVTSFYPMYIATANIVDGVEDVELVKLTEVTTGCLHDYQLTTANMVTLSTADALVINGGGMESFIEKAADTYKTLEIIDASKGILESHTHEHEEEHDGHNHGANAHIWVSISMHIKQIENIKNELVKLDSKNAEKYAENANNYISKLERLKQEMHEKLVNIEDKQIITFHEAFEFFAEEYGLKIAAVIEREPGTYPSAGEVAKIIDLVRSKDIKAIFVEPQYSRSAADTIARETKVKVYTLDPIVTGNLNKEAYIELMRNNMNALEEALK